MGIGISVSFQYLIDMSTGMGVFSKTGIDADIVQPA